MSKTTDDFWNELALIQMAAGQVPSIKTKKMQEALSGNKDAVNEIKNEIDTDKAIMEGQIYKAMEICKVVR